MQIVVTGGAGMVGLATCRAFRRQRPDAQVIALDNLSREGSGLRAHELQLCGVDVRVHDILDTRAFDGLEPDVIVHAAAEPSVGRVFSNPTKAIQTNVVGTLHVLEAARRRKASLILLSTSRVYPIASLRDLPLADDGCRFDLVPGRVTGRKGLTGAGITEEYPLDGRRSVYGATKLADEVLALEYGHAYGFPVYVNRCGLLSGWGQVGSTEQGLLGLWVGAHHYRQPLTIRGYGGKQVRDVLGVRDLARLLVKQAESGHPGGVWNVGGGRSSSISLKELTRWCRENVNDASPVTLDDAVGFEDIPWYVTNTAKVEADFGWAPKDSLADVLREVHAWIASNHSGLKDHFVKETAA